MSLTIIFSIIIIHWVADFIIQTDKQAKGKSKNWDDLLTHTVTYSLSWVVPIVIYSICNNLTTITLLFIPITFICHTATDYYTSRVNSQLYEKGDIHGFFISVGFDQVLHYIQLFLTFHYLTR